MIYEDVFIYTAKRVMSDCNQGEWDKACIKVLGSNPSRKWETVIIFDNSIKSYRYQNELIFI